MKEKLPNGVVYGAIAAVVLLVVIFGYRYFSQPLGGGIDPEVAKLQSQAERQRLPNGGQPGVDPNAPAPSTGFSPGREGAR